MLCSLLKWEEIWFSVAVRGFRAGGGGVGRWGEVRCLTLKATVGCEVFFVWGVGQGAPKFFRVLHRGEIMGQKKIINK